MSVSTAAISPSKPSGPVWFSVLARFNRQFRKRYVVVLTITNSATGDSLGAEQFRVESKEKILPALDKAAASLRSRLSQARRPGRAPS
jgi:hypothetical protein